MRFAFTKVSVRGILETVKEFLNVTVKMVSNQVRAARALLGWKQVDLARASGLSEMSIKNIERQATDPRSSTMTSIKGAFEEAGVIFLEPGDIRDGGYGVRQIKR